MGEIGPHEDLVEVQEGQASLLVPQGHARRGPGTVAGVPFYNRAMAFPRHISVLVLDALGAKGRRILDGLAATGALGVRLALEVDGPFDLTLNDRNPAAQGLIRDNLRRNGVRRVQVEDRDLNVLLSSTHYDYVDLDPFGSPVPFIDSALRALGPRGHLTVTATDTAALAGTYPKTCQRRYGAVPLRGPIGHEVAVRILVGYAVRMAARDDLGARPLLAFWRGHYYKAFLEIVPGAGRADRALAQLSYASIRGGERRIAESGTVGPLWAGPLFDLDLLENLRPRTYMPAPVSQLLARWKEEADAPPLFFTTDEVGRGLRQSPPSIKATLEALREQGFSAVRTSFHPKGIKTTATWKELLSAVAA